ncbi:MAG: zinc-binding dehydrogenase [Alphaproteobacteria bacterium]|nr:zinc-binding dehydrogenase [Alphaproteobacteria bacterium]
MLSYQVTEFSKPLARVAHETPRPTGRQVLLRTIAAGVCHSDLHIWDGYYDLGGGKKLTLGDRGIKLPLTMGHEVVGEVAAVGPEVSGVRVGDRRMAFPWIGCGKCPACDANEENLCLSMRSLGVFSHGGYADHVMVPDAKYLVDIDGVDPALAATYACSGVTAYGALKKIPKLIPGDHVALIGLGGVGLAGVAIAQGMIEAPIIAVDIDDAKLAAARAMGVAKTFNSSGPDAAKRLKELAGGRLAAAVDFVGASATARLGIDALNKGGTYIIVGLFGGDVTLPLVTIPMRALTVRGSYVGTLSEMRELLALVRSGKVRPMPVGRRRLDEVNQALEDLKAGRIVGRVVLAP